MTYVFCILVLAGLVFAETTSLAKSVPSPTESRSVPPAQKQELLWRKLAATVAEVDRELEGVMGVAILDLTDGKQLLLNADELFPIASSIKIAVLAELYHQEQLAAAGTPGKTRLADLYTMREADLVEDSAIMAGLTPGVTRVTNRDLATFMVAVSDNAATNVLIDRLGMENVNALLDRLGLKQTRLRRKMMNLGAARQGRENTSTPREMMTLLGNIYRGNVLNKELAADLLKVLSTRKESDIPRDLPADLLVANKPGSLEAVRTDSGIVFAKNRPFVISVMTTYVRNERAAELAIARIAAAAYRYFEMVGAASPYGRVISPRSSH